MTLRASTFVAAMIGVVSASPSLTLGVSTTAGKSLERPSERSSGQPLDESGNLRFEGELDAAVLVYYGPGQDFRGGRRVHCAIWQDGRIFEGETPRPENLVDAIGSRVVVGRMLAAPRNTIEPVATSLAKLASESFDDDWTDLTKLTTQSDRWGVICFRDPDEEESDARRARFETGLDIWELYSEGRRGVKSRLGQSEVAIDVILGGLNAIVRRTDGEPELDWLLDVTAAFGR